MKLDELEVGKIYGCRLTRRIILVIEQYKEVFVQTKVGSPIKKTIKVKMGKWFNKGYDSYEITYLYQELFDGQLEKVKFNKDGKWETINKNK